MHESRLDRGDAMQPPPGPYGQPPGPYGQQNAPNGACRPACPEARRAGDGAAAPSSAKRHAGETIDGVFVSRGRSIGRARERASRSRLARATPHPRLKRTRACRHLRARASRSDPASSHPARDAILLLGPRERHPRSRLSRRGRCSSGRTSATDDAGRGASRRRRRWRASPRTRDGRAGARGVGPRTVPGAVPGAASGASGGIRCCSQRVRAAHRADGAHGRRRGRAPDGRGHGDRQTSRGRTADDARGRTSDDDARRWSSDGRGGRSADDAKWGPSSDAGGSPARGSPRDGRAPDGANRGRSSRDGWSSRDGRAFHGRGRSPRDGRAPDGRGRSPPDGRGPSPDGRRASDERRRRPPSRRRPSDGPSRRSARPGAGLEPVPPAGAGAGIPGGCAAPRGPASADGRAARPDALRRPTAALRPNARVWFLAAGCPHGLPRSLPRGSRVVVAH